MRATQWLSKKCLAVKVTHRNHLHPYTLILKREIKIAIPFTTATRGIKFLGINVGKDLCAELNKAWRKQIKGDKINGEIHLYLWLGDSILWKCLW